MQSCCCQSLFFSKKKSAPLKRHCCSISFLGDAVITPTIVFTLYICDIFFNSVFDEQELEKENKAIDVKMSKYYQSPTTDRLDTTIFNVAFILLNMLVIVFLYLYYSNQTYGVYSLSVLQDVLNESNLILNLICYALGVVVLKILINAITLKCNTGSFRFGVSSRLCLKDLFYNSIGYSANTMYKYTMTGARIKLKNAENTSEKIEQAIKDCKFIKYSSAWQFFSC